MQPQANSSLNRWPAAEEEMIANDKKYSGGEQDPDAGVVGPDEVATWEKMGRENQVQAGGVGP